MPDSICACDECLTAVSASTAKIFDALICMNLIICARHKPCECFPISHEAGASIRSVMDCMCSTWVERWDGLVWILQLSKNA